MAFVTLSTYIKQDRLTLSVLDIILSPLKHKKMYPRSGTYV